MINTKIIKSPYTNNKHIQCIISGFPGLKLYHVIHLHEMIASRNWYNAIDLGPPNMALTIINLTKTLVEHHSNGFKVC